MILCVHKNSSRETVYPQCLDDGNVPAFKEWPTNFKLLFQALDLMIIEGTESLLSVFVKTFVLALCAFLEDNTIVTSFILMYYVFLLIHIPC